MTPKRRMMFAIALFLVASVVLVWRVLPYTSAYRERVYRGMSLEEQLRTQRDHVDDPIFLSHLGRKLNERGDFATADPYLERAAGLDPDSAVIRDEWARALMGHGRVTQAFGILKQFMATHPKEAEPALLLGKFYVSREDWKPALEAIETATQFAPKNAEGWKLLAHVWIKMGRVADAKTALATAISLAPNDSGNHLQLAALLDNDDSVRARAEYERAVALAPEDSVTLRQYGRFLLEHDDAAGAEKQANVALKSSKEDPFIYLLLGRALIAQSRWQEAVAPLEEADRLSPYDPQAAEQLRRVYRQTKQPDLAAKWDARYLQISKGVEERRRLQDATQARPKDRNLHHQFAIALAGIRDINGCVREEGFANRTPPDNAVTLAAAAADLNGAGFNAEALPLARQAAQTQSNPQAQEALGDALTGMGRLHEAGIHYEKIRDWKADRVASYKRKMSEAAARINRSSAPAETLLRKAHTEAEPAQAESDLAQAVMLEPTNTRCLRDLMRLQFAHQEIAQTLETARRLTLISPEDGVAHTHYVAARLAAIGDGALSEADGKDMDRRLTAAMDDITAAPLYFYDRGVVALKRGNAPEAVKNLKVAVSVTPNSVSALRWLAEAQSQTGDKSGAQQTLAQLQRVQLKQTLMARLADVRATEKDFKEAIALCETEHLSQQLQSIRAEAKRRFGAKF